MDSFFGTTGTLMQWLTLHHSAAYLVLGLGSFFETLIGPSFVVPGEIFFVSGGVLAGSGVLNIAYVAGAVYLGAILGDSTSYLLGYLIGRRIFKEGRFIFNPENFRKGDAFFKRYGPKAAFLARILGPLSWITPFLMGIYRVPYRKFLPYNVLGVLVGVGGFVLGGYIFGTAFTDIAASVGRFAILIPIGVVALIAGGYYVSKEVTAD